MGELIMSYLSEKKRLKIGVLMGGLSDEREISLNTGKAIQDALEKKGWEVVGIDVGRDICQRIRENSIDVAFLALHGRYGEDGTIQGMLEIMGIPYTGSGVLASALAINKILSKRLFQGADIPTPCFEVLDDLEGIPKESPFGMPVVIKPCSQGSTIGTHIVQEKAHLESAIMDAFRYDTKVIIEEYIPGRELTVGILGNEPLSIVEICPKSGFYSFQSKYTPGETDYLCPAAIGTDLTKKVQDLGLRAHLTLGCKDVSRVDFRLKNDGSPFCLEVNTIPGMTQTSLLPKAALEKGIVFPDLVEKILRMAL